MIRRGLLGFAAAWVVLPVLLAGCAGMRIVDSNVRAYSNWPAERQPGSYVFERLPSQQAQADFQAKMEAAAASVLQKLGFGKAAAADQADTVVQLGARVTRYPRAPWDDPWPMHTHFMMSNRTDFFYPTSMWMRMESPYYEREIGVVMRDRASGRVLYESNALHDGRWADTDQVLPAMFQAALKDFPKAAPTPQRVKVEIPR